MSVDTAVEAALRRDRLVVTAALTVVIVLAWAYLLAGAGMGMPAFETRISSSARTGDSTMMTAMTSRATWSVGYVAVMFVMWWIMMVAVMLPSAAPLILLFGTVNRAQRNAGRPHVATSVFALGYCAVWAVFSLVAVVLQWRLDRIGMLSPALVGNDTVFAGCILLSAGAYQLTPMKHACLRHCRSPVSYVSARWREGTRGAFIMGIEHGGFCVGCCWVLMGLLFVGGVMNLYWIVGLALFVLLEKTVPGGHWIGYVTGVTLLVAGAGTLAVALSG